MTRPRPIDPESMAEQIPHGLKLCELRRRVAQLIRVAVIASRGSVQIHRPCGNPKCPKIMRLGGSRWHTGSDGRISRIYCTDRCRAVHRWHSSRPKRKRKRAHR